MEVSSTPETSPEPVGPVVKDALAKLLPDEVSLEHFNTQYLQKHSTDGRAILASVKVSRLLNAPADQVESSIFAVFNPETTFDLKVGFADINHAPASADARSS